jgi:putative transposase
MKRLRFTDSQILAVLKQAEAGAAVPDLGSEHGISSATFYIWRSKFDGMDVLLMGRMKELEEENRRLKKLYIEAQIKTDAVAEALAKKLSGHLADARWPGGQLRRRA